MLTSHFDQMGNDIVRSLWKHKDYARNVHRASIHKKIDASTSMNCSMVSKRCHSKIALYAGKSVTQGWYPECF